jgi:MFS transporter, SHS family, lactate transporter
MTAAQDALKSMPWWKEPTKDQWLAFGAAWMGWTLDAFDFTMFLLLMVPISQEFNVPLSNVAFVLSVTLWLKSSRPAFHGARRGKRLRRIVERC